MFEISESPKVIWEDTVIITILFNVTPFGDS